MKEESPAHQHYPAQFLAETLAFTAEETGVYIWLRGACWSNRSIPDNLSLLAKMCKIRASKMHVIWSKIGSLFEHNVNGYFTHPGVEEEREKQLKYRESQRLSGKAGAESRWGRHRVAIGKTTLVPITSPLAENGSLSSSSISSVCISNEIHTQKGGSGVPSQRFQEWWGVWSAVRGTAHRTHAERAWFNVATVELEEAIMDCTRSYLDSLENPGKGYNPQNFLIQMAQDKFTGHFVSRKRKPPELENSKEIRYPELPRGR